MINSLEALAKTYLSFHQKLIFFKENSTKKKVTNFRTDLNQLDKILATLSQLIISCNDVKIDPALGLLPLQKNVLEKSKLCNEISLMAISVNTFILDKSIKNNLNRRVAQLKKCDISFEKLSKIAFFCRNKFELTWAAGLDNLAVTLESSWFNLRMASADVIHLANLLESSSIVGVEELVKINHNVDDKIIDILVKELPIYSALFRSVTYLVNFKQTTSSCDVINHIFGPAEENSHDKISASGGKLILFQRKYSKRNKHLQAETFAKTYVRKGLDV